MVETTAVYGQLGPVNRCSHNGLPDEQLCNDLWPLRVDTTVAEAALVALSLFFGIGINGEPEIAAGEAIVASQYVSAGKTPIEAQKEVASLNACFGTYEVPPEKQKPSQDADLAPLRNAENPIGK